MESPEMVCGSEDEIQLAIQLRRPFLIASSVNNMSLKGTWLGLVTTAKRQLLATFD